mgnify:CR=1 FL=1
MKSAVRLRRKIKVTGKNSEGGFVLIAAIMGIMILLAVGFLALTISSSDIRIASRLIGERKAFSAAESGVQDFMASFTPGDGEKTWTDVDSTNDPGVQFRINEPTRDETVPDLPAAGFGTEMSYAVYDATVTGRDNTYNSRAEIRVGAKYGPISGGFGYE